MTSRSASDGPTRRVSRKRPAGNIGDALVVRRRPSTTRVIPVTTIAPSFFRSRSSEHVPGQASGDVQGLRIDPQAQENEESPQRTRIAVETYGLNPTVFQIGTPLREASPSDAGGSAIVHLLEAHVSAERSQAFAHRSQQDSVLSEVVAAQRSQQMQTQNTLATLQNEVSAQNRNQAAELTGVVSQLETAVQQAFQMQRSEMSNAFSRLFQAAREEGLTSMGFGLPNPEESGAEVQEERRATYLASVRDELYGPSAMRSPQGPARSLQHGSSAQGSGQQSMAPMRNSGTGRVGPMAPPMPPPPPPVQSYTPELTESIHPVFGRILPKAPPASLRGQVLRSRAVSDATMVTANAHSDEHVGDVPVATQAAAIPVPSDSGQFSQQSQGQVSGNSAPTQQNTAGASQGMNTRAFFRSFQELSENGGSGGGDGSGGRPEGTPSNFSDPNCPGCRELLRILRIREQERDEQRSLLTISHRQFRSSQEENSALRVRIGELQMQLENLQTSAHWAEHQAAEQTTRANALEAEYASAQATQGASFDTESVATMVTGQGSVLSNASVSGLQNMQDPRQQQAVGGSQVPPHLRVQQDLPHTCVHAMNCPLICVLSMNCPLTCVLSKSCPLICVLNKICRHICVDKAILHSTSSRQEETRCQYHHKLYMPHPITLRMLLLFFRHSRRSSSRLHIVLCILKLSIRVLRRLFQIFVPIITQIWDSFKAHPLLVRLQYQKIQPCKTIRHCRHQDQVEEVSRTGGTAHPQV